MAAVDDERQQQQQRSPAPGEGRESAGGGGCSLRCLAATAAGLAIFCRIALSWIRPSILIVGPVTYDVVNGNKTVGGAATYAAAVSKAYGKRACIVVSAGESADLSVFEDHNVVHVPGVETLTFEHTYTWWGHQRKLRVVATPNVTLGVQHVPWRWLLAKVVLLGPLVSDDVNAAGFVRLSGIIRWLLPQRVGLMGQGFQRIIGTKGEVSASEEPSAELMAGVGAGVNVFLSDVETDPWPPESINKIVKRSERLLVTRGDEGALEHSRHGVKTILAEKVETVEDTNGAGDTFATAYMLALANNKGNPGAEAARAAARTVMQPQECKPWCISADMKLPLQRHNTSVQSQGFLHSLFSTLSLLDFASSTPLGLNHTLCTPLKA